MLCAFDGPPRIVRLHGRGEVLAADDPADGVRGVIRDPRRADLRLVRLRRAADGVRRRAPAARAVARAKGRSRRPRLRPREERRVDRRPTGLLRLARDERAVDESSHFVTLVWRRARSGEPSVNPGSTQACPSLWTRSHTFVALVWRRDVSPAALAVGRGWASRARRPSSRRRRPGGRACSAARRRSCSSRDTPRRPVGSCSRGSRSAPVPPCGS